MDDNACSARLNQQRFIVLVKTFLNKNGLFSSPSTYYLKIASVIFKTSVCVLSLILDKRYVFVSYLTKKYHTALFFKKLPMTRSEPNTCGFLNNYLLFRCEAHAPIAKLSKVQMSRSQFLCLTMSGPGT